MARKNPAAVALGRRTSPLKGTTSATNGALGGRPSVYRLTKGRVLERFTAGLWTALAAPYDDAAKAWLRRHPTSLPR